MVGSKRDLPEIATAFTLVPRTSYLDVKRRVETSKNEPEQPAPSTSLVGIRLAPNQNEAEGQKEEVDKANEESLVKNKIVESLKHRRGKGTLQASTIEFIDRLLLSKRLDVQLSDLQITIDGQPIGSVKAPQFIYDVQRYNKKVPIDTYTIIIRGFENLPKTLIKNRILLKAISDQDNITLVGSGSTASTTTPLLLSNAASSSSKKKTSSKETGQVKKTTRQKTQTNTRIKQERSSKGKRPHKQQQPIWITFRE